AITSSLQPLDKSESVPSMLKLKIATLFNLKTWSLQRTDIVMHSATKSISGHADVMAGVLVAFPCTAQNEIGQYDAALLLLVLLKQLMYRGKLMFLLLHQRLLALEGGGD
ncbi:hypothetical protein MKW98_026285, partial [Papaver atlanticum]